MAIAIDVGVQHLGREPPTPKTGLSLGGGGDSGVRRKGVGVKSGTIARNGTQSCSRRLRLGAGSAPSRVWPVLTVPYGGGCGLSGGKARGRGPPRPCRWGCVGSMALSAPPRIVPARHGASSSPTGAGSIGGWERGARWDGDKACRPPPRGTPHGVAARGTGGCVSYLILGDFGDSFGQ